MAAPLAIVGMGFQVAQGIMGYEGAKQAGEAQAAQARYMAAIARMNAQYAEEQAAYDISAGEQRAQAAGLQARGKAGLDKVRASGLDPNTGSMRASYESELAIGEEDQALRRNDAQLAAWKAKVTAAQDSAQGQLYDMSAQNALDAANIRATTSLLSAGAGVAGKWTQGTTMGIFPGAAASMTGTDAAPTNYYSADNTAGAIPDYSMPTDI